jgi:DNA mismatch repair protein MutL
LGVIKLLPDSVKKKIAAGEVVEAPFSIVKELVENSIDAGADRIDIQVAECGLKKIAVGDNGSGIYRDDMVLAVAEHATSKIRDIHDIEQIRSYGFRGEALSSISSVSRLTILSRRAEEEAGARLYASGDGFEVADFAGAAGTTVIVENLFYNIPARKKFLKAMRTELRAIRETIVRISIPNPHIAFNLDVDGKRLVTLTSAGSIDRRIEQIYGSGIMKDLYFSGLKDFKVAVSGFFSRPDFLRSSRSMQLLFVNKRPVDYRNLGFLLSRAYEAVAIKGKFPAGIVFIDIDPELVDVNIHPAKKEVKFFDHHYLDRLIISLAEKVLNREHPMRDRLFAAGEANKTESGSAAGGGLIPQGNIFKGPSVSNPETRSKEEHYQETSMPPLQIRNVGDSYQDIESDKEAKILGIAFGAYIILERNGELYFIDFHAAHERIIYDSLIGKRGAFESQALAFPLTLELSIEDHALVLENIENFSEIGFDIEDFSDNTIKISAVPEVAREADISGIVADFISSTHDARGTAGIADRMAMAVACHAAKRAGDVLSPGDIDRLIRTALADGSELRCPHGRPFVYKIGREDLERIFKRR